MDDGELKQSEAAFAWVKANHTKVVESFASTAEHPSDDEPITLFMAGSPGAGKTEVSKRLISRFKQKPIRIDADEIRALCPGYAGSNAHLFQKAATKGVHLLYDYALKKNINMIIDGTFAYGDRLRNIGRSLEHKRKVEIFFVYQDPLRAWDFTKKREQIEKRRVSKGVFIETFFKSRENVNAAKKYFRTKIELNLMVKDFEKGLEELEINIENLDPYLPKDYTREDLEKLLL